jgi:hypothetical protein
MPRLYYRAASSSSRMEDLFLTLFEHANVLLERDYLFNAERR